MIDKQNSVEKIKVIRYLNNIYKSDFKKEENTTKEYSVDKSLVKNMKKYIKDNTDKIVFYEKHSGPYCQKLEKHLSLNKSNVKKIDAKVFSKLYYTLEKNGNLTSEMHEKYNRAVLIQIHKKGDMSDPSNYRYLYNFSNNIKLLDKLWSINICNALIGKVNDKNLLSYHTRFEFNESIRGMASKFTDNIDNKIMLDFEKAFDNVSFYSISKLLKKFLIRKLGEEKGKYYFDRYFNIITNTNIYFDKVKIKRNKGIPTGLPSSNLVFTMIMEQIFYEFTMIKPDFTKFFDFYVYVDDIAIIVKDNTINIKDYIDCLLNIFDYYMFKCNSKKCNISKNISSNYKNFEIITPETKYLGIYFSRNLKEYINIIIKEYNEKKKQDCKTIADMIKYKKNSARLYLKYKLYPFINKKLTI